MFADDICLFSPSLVGLEDLLNTCYNYAQSHKMLFNCNKSFGMLFAPKIFNLSSSPKLLIDNSEISFVHVQFSRFLFPPLVEQNTYINVITRQSVKYLGLHINSDLIDDIDIQRQVESFYFAANKLKYQFDKCSLKVKNYLFKHFCMPFYESHLSCNYRKYNFSRLRVAYITILVEFCTTYLDVLVRCWHSRTFRGGRGAISPPSFYDLGKIKIFRAVRKKYLGKT